MAFNQQRAIAWFFAVIFILSTSIVSVAVFYDMVQNNKQPELDASSAANDKSQEAKVDGLQGKPLAGFTPVAEIKELQKIDTTPGSGAAVKASDTVTVDYTGAFASSGLVFESSKDSGQPATFPLGEVIKGWTQGIPGMQVGGTRRLLIPSDLAYGPEGRGTIPGNADLVFDVTLIKIGQ